jgi:hypothetical protein
LRVLPGQVAKSGGIATNFYFGGAVDHNLDGALATVGTAATGHYGSALIRLSVQGCGHRRQRCNCHKHTFHMESPAFHMSISRAIAAHHPSDETQGHSVETHMANFGHALQTLPPVF